MSQNKITTYLLYALGEVVLVVAGILIALQIDSWAQYADDREKEAFLLAELHREMNETLIRFENLQSSVSVIVESGNELIKRFPLLPENFEDPKWVEWFRIHFPEFRYNPTFDPIQGTIKSIISNGDIDLIENDELRLLIISWNDMYNDYKEEELIAWEYGYQIMDWMTDHTPNPRYVNRKYTVENLKKLQSRIGEKVERYDYVLNGDDAKRIKQHITRMIELTSKKGENVIYTSKSQEITDESE